MSKNQREGVPREGWLPRWTQRIDDVERMRPFLMSVASPSDHWMFLSSTGALTAGRKSAEYALFPYRTVDRVHDAEGRVGGKTIVRCADGTVWEPFTERSAATASRSVERSAYGTSVTLIERSGDLEARQTWSSSHTYGVLRFFELVNHGTDTVQAEVLDGLLDVLPATVDVTMQQTLSTLIDAYRRVEVTGGVAAFGLGSIPVDRAEPREAMRANTVWCTVNGPRLLCERQLGAFRRGEPITDESKSRGVRACFLVQQDVEIAASSSASWAFALEVHQAADDVERTMETVEAADDPLATLRSAANDTERELVALLADADALQCTGSDAEDARHYANTLYNVMRGGVPVAPPEDVPTSGDPDERRHALETLPLALSRRHGDPSRPWNRFSIDVRGEDGSIRTGYEGNWRDIFQNWEALGTSYPAYLTSFIVRFLNASTADGYNPYRIHDGGIDWEVHDPNDPWSFIGYWGDHQIVYLTRLIERHVERFPGELTALLGDAIFVHADVPYRIRGFDAIAADPQATVDYDEERAAKLDAATERYGPDGKLLRDASDDLVRSTLEEKLLVPVLAKLSNLVPGAGIWMSTQRPEWNDANNALVGIGASMVTTCALVRHIEVLCTLFEGRALRLSERTVTLLRGIEAALAGTSVQAATSEHDARWNVTEGLGRAGEVHRSAVASGEGLGSSDVDGEGVIAALSTAREWLTATVDANRRDDGLLHTYNTLRIETGKGIEVHRLQLMLEGQVAALSAGLANGDDAVRLLRALRESPLYWPDQHSYILYPDRELTSLLDRGRLAERDARGIGLVFELMQAGDRSIVRPTADGEGVRFAPELYHADALAIALAELASGPHGASIARDHGALLHAYETSFQHASFTGRSGTFFGYEGLGCIYWHMVSKLVLAAQETYYRAIDEGLAASTIAELRSLYHDVRAGLPTHKTPAEYGAFPSEPYSHTPGDGGARQPGMTGQVKEDVLGRMGDHGIRPREGRLTFERQAALDPSPCGSNRVLPRGGEDSIEVPADAAALTHCGVPVVMRRGDHDEIHVTWTDASREATVVPGRSLDEGTSRAVWLRDGTVARLDVVAAKA